MLGDGIWRRAFGADPGVLGSRITVDGVQRTIIGVMPAGFAIGGPRVEIWLPLALGPVDPEDRGQSLPLPDRPAAARSHGGGRAGRAGADPRPLAARPAGRSYA